MVASPLDATAHMPGSPLAPLANWLRSLLPVSFQAKAGPFVGPLVAGLTVPVTTVHVTPGDCTISSRKQSPPGAGYGDPRRDTSRFIT